MWRSFSLLVVLAVFSVAAFAQVVFAGEVEAASAIASARQQLVVCFQAASDAEAAGANITSLARVLNDAGNLLSEAEFAYEYGDFGLAQDLAGGSSAGLANFVPEANGLRDAAVQQSNYDFSVNVIGSIAGTIIVIVVGVVIWFLAKKRFAPRVEEPLGWREAA